VHDDLWCFAFNVISAWAAWTDTAAKADPSPNGWTRPAVVRDFWTLWRSPFQHSLQGHRLRWPIDETVLSRVVHHLVPQQQQSGSAEDAVRMRDTLVYLLHCLRNQFDAAEDTAAVGGAHGDDAAPHHAQASVCGNIALNMHWMCRLMEEYAPASVATPLLLRCLETRVLPSVGLQACWRLQPRQFATWVAASRNLAFFLPQASASALSAVAPISAPRPPQ